MKVAKRFRWEAAHRLPWHDGPCDNLHGHSYRMTVALEGTPDARGMLVDFQDLKRVLKPLVDAWDHAILVAETDDELRGLVEQTDWKYALLPADTTAENLATYVADYLRDEAADLLAAHGVTAVRVRLAETETCYAEVERRMEATASTGAHSRGVIAE